jgi:hypothetical protein
MAAVGRSRLCDRELQRKVHAHAQHVHRDQDTHVRAVVRTEQRAVSSVAARARATSLELTNGKRVMVSSCDQ